MNLIGLILFVVVLISEDVLPKSRIDRNGVILQVYKVTLEVLIDRLYVK